MNKRKGLSTDYPRASFKALTLKLDFFTSKDNILISRLFKKVILTGTTMFVEKCIYNCVVELVRLSVPAPSVYCFCCEGAETQNDMCKCYCLGRCHQLINCSILVRTPYICFLSWPSHLMSYPIPSTQQHDLVNVSETKTSRSCISGNFSSYSGSSRQ